MTIHWGNKIVNCYVEPIRDCSFLYMITSEDMCFIFVKFTDL